MLFVLSVAGLLAVFLYYVGRCQADERIRAIEYQQRLRKRSVSSPVPPAELSVRLAALRARVLALSSGPAADHTPLPAPAPSPRVARIRQGVPLVVRPTRIPTPVPSRVFSALPLVLERDARPFAETLGPVAATPMDIRNILRAQRLVANVAAEARSSNSLPRKSALRTTNSVENTKRVSFHEAVTVVNVEKGSTGAIAGAGVDGGRRLGHRVADTRLCVGNTVALLAQAAREDWSFCGSAKRIASRCSSSVQGFFVAEDANRLIQGRITYPTSCGFEGWVPVVARHRLFRGAQSMWRDGQSWGSAAALHRE
ncbi:hypothetical protein A7C99_2844 [Trichophyton rubrum]|uniref:Uncharacterized protein n=1 Tax=Trichophyton rubrum TaxID=5551 RepID=A0A178F156_TRIRU|nr:hypothetical protein A7C99_2844 [Trichophyton rubrum]